ncbi:hypothetical protein BOX37_14240 [Nocardia mangyaensis]|uniref:Major facilitator superfamily (MFS) profile domain-containing protein n=1 Tax=Nocardia mangyaensis TaxID=2213200 RepID=A0A1J0W228_9NOCA|nr:MFS transporter [Nocardia mangyaensis]APE38330.1 hypothetical protein BOX37_14240 [Nocardia mangyaensis]
MPHDPQPRRWRVLALLATAFFMTILDSTIVVTALPSIAADLGMDDVGGQWVVTAYVLAFGALLLFFGRVADLLGRRRMFIGGNALWVAASLLCGLAPSGELLIAGRGLQGLAAAVIAPAALSIVMVTFPAGPERNKALALWGGLGGVGATVGLVLGGLITDGLGWEFIFFVNVPVGIVVGALSLSLLRESREAGAPRTFDVAGAVLVTAALSLLVYAITQIPTVGWSHPRTLGLFVVACVFGGLLIVVESRCAAPLVPGRILRSRLLIGGNLLIFTAGMAVDGLLITLTAYVQRVLEWSALQFGLLAAVMTVTSVVAIVAVERSIDHIGMKWAAVAGSTLLGAGCLILVSTAGAVGSVSILVAGLLVFGAGMGAAFVSAQIAALTDVRAGHSGLAAGLVDTSFSIGSCLGVALATTAALIGGYQTAFAATAVIAAVGVVIGLTLLHRPSRTADEVPDLADELVNDRL